MNQALLLATRCGSHSQALKKCLWNAAARCNLHCMEPVGGVLQKKLFDDGSSAIDMDSWLLSEVSCTNLDDLHANLCKSQHGVGTEGTPEAFEAHSAEGKETSALWL